MAVETLLARLDHVRKTGRAQWVACCPAHESKSRASLSIAEAADGRVLMHCFGGCAPLAVLEAVGLDFADLFPERDPDDVGRANGWRDGRAKDARQRLEQLHPRTALTAIAADVTEAAVIVSDVAEGRVDAERVRADLWTLAGRIASALSMAGVRIGC
ncbi:MAG TPA: hypothetical protein VGE10_06760 [Zeimonas sp.]